jgi:YD repeat-containing protein
LNIVRSGTHTNNDNQWRLKTYAWDARDRLTVVARLASFPYDGLGRWQTVTLSGTGWDVAEEQ